MWHRTGKQMEETTRPTTNRISNQHPGAGCHAVNHAVNRLEWCAKCPKNKVYIEAPTNFACDSRGAGTGQVDLEWYRQQVSKWFIMKLSGYLGLPAHHERDVRILNRVLT